MDKSGTFTKCTEEKEHSEALLQDKQLLIGLGEKLKLLQSMMGHDEQEKKALRAENVRLVSDNVELQGQLHEQQALSVRLQETVDDLQKQIIEIKIESLHCPELISEFEATHGYVETKSSKMAGRMNQKKGAKKRGATDKGANKGAKKRGATDKGADKGAKKRGATDKGADKGAKKQGATDATPTFVTKERYHIEEHGAVPDRIIGLMKHEESGNMMVLLTYTDNQEATEFVPTKLLRKKESTAKMILDFYEKRVEIC
uniref:Chromo shadow domain-containing protein n=1 Tax=Globodera rostochiensis TaxID=31243 RepID=A0A914ID30_GLORO